MNTQKSIPSTAFQFRMTSDLSMVKPTGGEAGAENQPRKFKGVAYSGQPLNHPYWGQVVFDVSSTRAAAETTPFLVDHNPSKRAGFGALNFTGGRITVEDGTLLSNDHGSAIATESDEGFPWQLSVFIDPASIEEVLEGGSTTVNGNAITGRAVIFRNALIREVSFCAVGVDYHTEALALSTHAAGAPINQEDNLMDLKELEAQVATMKASLEAATARAEQAEQQLAANAKAERETAVKALFSATGREYTEASAAPYLALDAAAFSAISADMQISAKGLFSQLATNGVNPDSTGKGTGNSGGSASSIAASLNPSAIYAKRASATHS